MKVLILGYSSIFKRRVLPALEAIDQIETIDIASTTQNLVDFTSLKKGECFNNYEDAIVKTKATLVYISLRNNDHAHMARLSLENGRHVIVDKPAFIDEDEGVNIIKLANQKNLCLAEALLYQHHPQISQIKEIFANSDAVIRTISTQFSFPGLNTDNFRYKRELGGGAILDQGPYAMNLGYEIFGEMPISCKAITNEDDEFEVDTSFNLILQFPQGKSLMGYFGFGTEYINSASFFSKELSLSLDRIYTIPPDYENQLFVKEKNIERVEITEKADAFLGFFGYVVNQIDKRDFSQINDQTKLNYDLLRMLMKSVKEN